MASTQRTVEDGAGTLDTVTPRRGIYRAFTDDAGAVDYLPGALSSAWTASVVVAGPGDDGSDPSLAPMWATRAGAVHLRVLDKDRRTLALLPDWVGLSLSTELNAPGSIVFDYPNQGVNAEFVHQDVGYIAVVVEGKVSPDLFLIEDDADDPSDALGRMRLTRVSGRGVLAVLEQAVVYPGAHRAGKDPDGLTQEQKFNDLTPGHIMRVLINRAKARGAINDLHLACTDTHDSAGNRWPTLYDIRYTVGLDYLSVITAMCDNGWCDVRTSGFALQMFVPNTALAKDTTKIIRKGQQVIDSPNSRRKTRRGLATTALGVGEETRAMEIVDGDAYALYGRREGYVGDGRVNKASTLTRVTEQALAETSHPSETFTLKLALDEPAGEHWEIPGRDFTVGQFIRYDGKRYDSGGLEPLRVRSITWEWDTASGQPRTATIELADRFLERAIRLKRRIEGILNGSSTDAPPPTISTQAKIVASPVAPSSVEVVSDTYRDDTGKWYAIATASWESPTSEDGTIYAATSHFLVSRVTGRTWSGAVQTEDLSIDHEGLVPGSTYQFRVRSVSAAGLMSAWVSSSVTVLAVDVTAPPVPTAPTATARLGQVTLSWDGKNVGNTARASDFSHVEIHVSTSNGFLPSTATLVDGLTGAGLRVLSGLAYNATVYARLVAVDINGNKSDGSAQASVTVVPLVDTDVIGSVISGTKITPGTLVASDAIVANTITGGLIQALAINTGHLQANAVTADQIAAGAIQAEKIALGVIGQKQLAVGPTNLIPDGIFEDVDWRTARAATLQAGVTFVAGAGESGYGLRFALATGAGTIRLVSAIPGGIAAQPGQKFHMRARVRAVGSSNATAGLRAAWVLDTAATVTSPAFSDYVSVASDGAWHTIEGVVTAPAGTITLIPRFGAGTTGTAGTLTFDNLDCRPVLASTAESGRAVEISPMGIKMFGSSSLTGARLEVDADGLRAFNSVNQETIRVESATGDVTLVGSLETGHSGIRMKIQPTDAGGADINFYPPSGSDFALISGAEYTQTGRISLLVRAQGNDNGNYGAALISPSGFQAGYFNNSPFLRSEGGRFYADATLASMGSYDAGERSSEYRADGDQLVLFGRFPRFLDTGSTAALLTGFVTVDSGVSVQSISYGTTKATIMLPLITVRDNPSAASTRAVVVTANTTSAFTVQLSGAPAAGWSLYMWVFRV